MPKLDRSAVSDHAPTCRPGPGWRAAVTAAVVAALAAIAFALWFTSAEQRIFAYDFVGYQRMTEAALAAWREGPAAWGVAVRASFATDYPILFTAPLLPPLLVLGDGRAAVVAALTLVYQIPWALAVGAVAAALLPAERRERKPLAFALGVVLALLLTAGWIPTLQARPDIGAAALVAAAVAAWLADAGLQRWRTGLILALCLGFAVLVRRHFAYPALLVLATAGAGVLWLSGGAPRPLLRGGMVLALAGGGALAVMLVVAPDFVLRIAAGDYADLYSSYEKPPLTGAAFFAGAFGLVTLAAAGVGFGLGLRRGGLLERRRAVLLLVLTMAWLAVWLVVVKQPNPHRTIHLLPLPVVAGLVALALASASATMRRRAVTAVTMAAAVLFAVSVWPGDHRMLPEEASSTRLGLLARPFVPVVEADRAQVLAVAEALRRHGADGGTAILVTAASRAINASRLDSADRLLRPEAPRLPFLTMPQVDSVAPLPLSWLLQAQWVVTATPPQYHLAAAEQDVMRLANAALTDAGPLAADFEAVDSLPVGDATLTLWRRLRPTDAVTAARAAAAMVAAAGDALPAQQGPLAVVASPFPAEQRPAALVTHPGTRAEPTVLALLHPRAVLHGRIVFADPACVGVVLATSPGDTVTLRPGEGDGTFSLPLPPVAAMTAAAPAEAVPPLLTLTGTGPAGDAIAYCSVILAVEPGSR